MELKLQQAFDKHCNATNIILKSSFINPFGHQT